MYKFGFLWYNVFVNNTLSRGPIDTSQWNRDATPADLARLNLFMEKFNELRAQFPEICIDTCDEFVEVFMYVDGKFVNGASKILYPGYNS